MIKNEENFTKLNNEIYFDENGELRRRSSRAPSSMKKYGLNENKKENCTIM